MGLKRIPIPASVKISDDQQSVNLVWPNAREQKVQASLLRRACTCAHCVDEMTGAAILDPSTVAEDIMLQSVRTVGRYGLQFAFSDTHDTGIYTFEALAKLA